MLIRSCQTGQENWNSGKDHGHHGHHHQQPSSSSRPLIFPDTTTSPWHRPSSTSNSFGQSPGVSDHRRVPSSGGFNNLHSLPPSVQVTVHGGGKNQQFPDAVNHFADVLPSGLNGVSQSGKLISDQGNNIGKQNVSNSFLILYCTIERIQT